MSELFEDLDPKIAGPLQRITEALKAEIGSQIEGVRQDVQSLVGAEPGAARAAEVPPADAVGEVDALEELKHAAAGIDRATKQASILSALLEGASRFSSRAAFILIRDDGQRCWGSLGFDDAGRELNGASIDVPNGSSAWARIQDGAGTRGLSAEECASFCAQFEAPTPSVGALLPLSLGDQVAGYLYADRVGDGHLNITALQLLTFVAGQTLETLPLRKRTSTPTLVVAGAESVAPAEPAAVEEPPPVEVPELEDEAAAEEAVAVKEPPVEEAPAEEPEPEALDAVVADEPEPAMVPEPGAEAAPEGLLETIPVEVVSDEDDAEVAVEEEAEPELEAPAADADGATAEFYEVDSAEIAPPEVEEPEVEEAEPVETAATDEVAPAEGATAEIPLPAGDEPVEAPVEESTPEPPVVAQPETPTPPPAADDSSTQVVPPDDVLGPGWAFTAKDSTDESGNEALHEEARRLARLLVTEIKLYNEEQVEQGRRGRDIYRRLQEDIDRSRQIFEDRIEEQIRNDNDYFKEALVRILAGGDESLLGM